MSMIKGFIFGTIVGVAIGSSISERQRRDLIARMSATAKNRARPVTDAVARNASDVADKVTDAAVDKVDTAGDRAVDAVESTVGSDPVTT